MIVTLVLRILLITGLSLIFYQDLKERAVWWFLFPLFTLIAGYFHFTESLSWLFLPNILFNVAAVAGIFLMAFLYAHYKMKVNFLKEAVGLGDIFFFLGLAVAFPSEVFIVILVFSMIFALGLHAFVSPRKKSETVPLAGYASLFLIYIYVCSWSGLYKNLYFIG